ncbi:MAG TPA: GFA family protein [Polyangiaceae bacterium]|nr:GFA family protein [Polyangiaceae bacterium]
MLRGQCYCGAVQFQVEDDFRYAFYCHCSRCRRRTGAACAAIAGIDLEKLTITAGTEFVAQASVSDRGYRCICRKCCSPIYDALRNSAAGTVAHVQLGALSDTPSRVPDHHIHVASKAPWHAIRDGLPQYDELP